VLTRDPLNAIARLSLARIESDQGHYIQSIQLLKPILPAVQQTPDGLLTLAASYLGAGDKVSAKSLVADWKALNESRYSFSSLATIPECGAQVITGVSQRRVQLDSSPQAFQGASQIASLARDKAKKIVSFRMIGIDLHYLPERFFCSLFIALG
jgi:hypothetical protein